MTIKIQPGKYYRLKGGGVMQDRLILVANTASHPDGGYERHNVVGRYWNWNRNGVFTGRWEDMPDYPMHVEREILE